MLAAAGTDGDRPLGANLGVLSPLPPLGVQLDMAAAAGYAEHVGFAPSDAVVDPLLARSAGLAGFGTAAANAATGRPVAAAGVVDGETTPVVAMRVQQIMSDPTPPVVSACHKPCAQSRSALFKVLLLTILPGERMRMLM